MRALEGLAAHMDRDQQEPGEHGASEHTLHRPRPRRARGELRADSSHRGSDGEAERHPAHRPPPVVASTGQGEQQHGDDQHHERGHRGVAVDHLLDRLRGERSVDLEHTGSDQRDAGQGEQDRERTRHTMVVDRGAQADRRARAAAAEGVEHDAHHRAVRAVGVVAHDLADRVDVGAHGVHRP